MSRRGPFHILLVEFYHRDCIAKRKIKTNNWVRISLHLAFHERNTSKVALEGNLIMTE